MYLLWIDIINNLLHLLKVCKKISEIIDLHLKFLTLDQSHSAKHTCDNGGHSDHNS